MTNHRNDSSFLDDALHFASREAQQWVADALACHLHNTGYALEGNTEANDVEWFAQALYQDVTSGVRTHWENATEEFREGYRRTARTVIRVLPDFQLRVAHRLIALSKVVRDIERARRKEVRALASRTLEEPQGEQL